MPFCHAPWTSIDISPQGTIAPCCKFRFGYYSEPPFNIKTADIEDYKQSKTLIQIKNDFKNNKWPQGCERCRIEEENGIASKRQMDYNRWQHHYDSVDPCADTMLTASVAFGNTCNLTCITCNPSASSKWQKEYQVLTGLSISPNHFYKKGFVEEFFENSKDLVHLDITGGEPFLSGVKEQHELLEKYISNGSSKNISLHYTTNVTIFPEDTWWELWENFKEIDIQLSIDGIENRYNYIRFPGDWTQVLINVKKYLEFQAKLNNVRLSVSYTVSAYNVFYIPEFLRWCSEIDLPTPWLGRVHNPTYMRPSVWPSTIKQTIVDHLTSDSHPVSQSWAELLMNQDDSQHYPEFVEKTNWHDQYRGLNFKETFPELAHFI